MPTSDALPCTWYCTLLLQQSTLKHKSSILGLAYVHLACYVSQLEVLQGFEVLEPDAALNVTFVIGISRSSRVPGVSALVTSLQITFDNIQYAISKGSASGPRSR